MLQQLITDNIDLWTSAETKRSTTGRGSNKKIEITGIKKLRELILELAVRGLLVPQDPNNEPASVLLAKIATEKEALFKAGKIKKQKPSPEITEDEKPFALPDHWEWTRLQQISEYIQRGKGPKYAEQGTVRVVSQKCVQWSGFDLSKARYVDDSSLDNYQEERFLKTNDLLWNSTGTGTVGRINVISTIDGSLVADSHVTVVRLLGVNSPFVGCFLTSPRIQLRIEPDHENALVSGTTNQVELNTSAVNPILIPLPPLDEQQRIVAKVDELMALCDQLEQQHIQHSDTHHTLVTTLLDSLSQATEPTRFQAIWSQLAANFDTLFTTEASIDQLKQIILQLAVMGKLLPQDPSDEPASVQFEKVAEEKARQIKQGEIKKQKPLPPIKPEEVPYELPLEWEWKRLPDISFFQEGPGILAKDFRNTGVPLIRIAGMKNDSVSLEGCNYLDEKMVEKKWAHFRLDLDDVVLSSSASLGKVSKVRHDTVGCIVYTGLIRFKPYNCLSDKFLIRFLNSDEFVRQINLSKTGAAIKHFGPSHLRNMIIPLPSLAEQHRIVAKVDELMVLCDQLKVRLNQAQTTQQKLAHAIVEQAVA